MVRAVMLIKGLVQRKGPITIHTSHLLSYTPVVPTEDSTPTRTDSPCLQCFAYGKWSKANTVTHPRLGKKLEHKCPASPQCCRLPSRAHVWFIATGPIYFHVSCVEGFFKKHWLLYTLSVMKSELNICLGYLLCHVNWGFVEQAEYSEQGTPKCLHHFHQHAITT